MVVLPDKPNAVFHFSSGQGVRDFGIGGLIFYSTAVHRRMVKEGIDSGEYYIPGCNRQVREATDESVQQRRFTTARASNTIHQVRQNKKSKCKGYSHRQHFPAIASQRHIPDDCPRL